MLKALIIFITILTAGCDFICEDNEQAKYELLNKHDYSVIQILGYKYRDTRNKTPYLILLDLENVDDTAIAFPIKDKNKGYVVILVKTDYPPLVKYLPKEDFIVTQEAFQAVTSQVSLSKEVEDFIEMHLQR